MSRPTKQGIDYFPLDCQFDNETELLISEQGGISVSVLITVWQLIYQNNGYYILDNDDLYLLIRKRIMIDVDIIKTIIKSAIKRGIFCTKKHKKHKILTSKGIQSRYVIASRLKKNINIVKNYLCIEVSNVKNYTYIKVNGDVNATKEEVEEEVEEEEEKDVEKRKRLGQFKKSVSIPKDYSIQPEHIKYAMSKNISEEVAKDQFEVFKIHHTAKGTKFKDWYASYQLWIRNSIKFGNITTVIKKQTIDEVMK